ncbi:hypothetical protein DCAR_0624936 [Daucus carota subsp. sativus]|uniref:Histone deacetylase interacting domain-containing protein n=1 Tax=Daucus carota subsp. sativus TaxID=79200 RepID=A0A164W4M5_DAUCS|nr:hypothetical protein DCAR_0624936 [Daucus carota subsp. sativus]
MEASYERAIEFVHIVKQRFVDQPSKYSQFASILSALNSSNKMQDGGFLVSKLKDLFVDGHQDLLLALDEFLPKDMVFEQKDDDDKYSWLLRDWKNQFFNKIRNRCIEKDDKSFSVLIKFCEVIVSCDDKRMTAKEADLEFQVLFKDDVDLYIECTQVLAKLWEDQSNEEPGLDYSSVGFVDKMPKVARKRTLYDETRAAKEFYMYEMGLAMGRIESTMKKLDGDPETFGECFSVHDSRCILKLYKGRDPDYTYGEELLEILRSDPHRCILARGVVQQRLRQKMAHLMGEKLRLDQAWKEIFEDIREKGVVWRHRGFLEQMREFSRSNCVGN